MNKIILTISFILINTALYAEKSGAKAPSIAELLVMPAGFFLIMYFFIIRPQQKKAKVQSEMLSALKKNDEVVTSGGIIAVVRSVSDGFVSLDLGNGTFIKVLKANVTAMTKSTTQAPAKK